MSFVYHEPETLEEALALLSEHQGDARVLAGGTSFAIMSKLGLVRPGHVVALRRIGELHGIHARPPGTWLGACATHRSVEESSLVRTAFPSLATAFGTIASVRIREQATVGGNLAHADPAHDPPPCLISLDATARVAAAGRPTRAVAVKDLFADYYTTVLADDEILLGVEIPPMPPGAAAVYLKFRPRTVDDYATVAVAALVARDGDGTVTEARVALGGVGPVPLRAASVEAALIGIRPDASSLRDAAGLVGAEVRPLDDVRGSAAYKRRMAVVWVRRALATVTGVDEAA